MPSRLRGLARVSKSSARMAEWNQYVPGRPRATHRTQTFPSAALARKFVEQHNAKITLGMVGEIVPIAFDEALAEYTGSLGMLAKNTRKGYACDLNVFAREIAQGMIVSDLTARHIDQFVAMLLNNGRSEATISRYVNGSLSAFFGWCVKRNYLESSPLAQATSLPSRKHVRATPPMSFEAIERLVDSLDTEDRRIAVAFAAMRPIDRGVLSKLHSGQVNLQEGRLEFQREKRRRSGGHTILMPIPPVLLPALWRRCSEAGRNPSSPLFRGLSRSKAVGARNWWTRATTAAGVPDLWFRDLRKFSASYLLTVAPEAMVRHFLGHSQGDGSIMGRHYTQLMPQVVAALQDLPVPGFSRQAPTLQISSA